MPENESTGLNRRGFLQAGAVAATAATVITTGTGAAQEEAKSAATVLPRRQLGKTGVEVTLLNQGTWRKGDGIRNILNTAYASGIRMYDTAKSYGSEPDVAKWLASRPEIRKEIFLVTKDTPKSPKDLIGQLDQRLESLQTDYVDLFFIHALGDHGVDQGLEWPKSQEFKETVAAIKKSGKAKFVGFSTHHARRAEIIQAAADGGFVDAIMLQYTPWLDKDAPLNRALDAAHKKGIGLISMKQVAGQFGNATGGVLNEVVKKVPMLKERGLTPFQGLLHAIWTDERISAACVSMRNLDQVKENAAAAKTYKPVEAADLHLLRDACLAHGPTLCADCDGRCGRAAGTTAALGTLTRYLTYFEYHGDRLEARNQYAALSAEERCWAGADLEAARAACPNHLDFAELLPRVDEHLA